ncbi:hypothetical protein KCH_62870 [Kitasatospora cheerisanensis KCTC 2395]|uniref:Uncharacterized protein n=1 Tax=Kitasatospora cheerisanensis KCTC 2395 TaxID=1348663 RepID=A0A066YVK5_9ACTN|nr:hypothetical protein KCH_62870 [Kitasatospora cheerisanensis KCTC 2395]
MVDGPSGRPGERTVSDPGANGTLRFVRSAESVVPAGGTGVEGGR